MADLTGTTPADTYKGLLQVNDYTDGVAGNTGSNALAIQDGAGNATALAVSTDNVGIGITSPDYKLHIAGGTPAMKLEGSQPRIWLSENDQSDLNSLIRNNGAIFQIDTAADNDDFIANRFSIKHSDGNVGIGTTDPSKRLEVQLTDNTAYTDGVTSNSLKLRNLSQSADSYSGIELTAGQTSGGGANIARIYAIKESDLNTATSLAFTTRKSNQTVSEAMRIDSDGSVGIGAASPDAPLHIKTSNTTDTLLLEATSDVGLNAPDLVLYRNSASPAADDKIGVVKFRGQHSSGGTKDYANIQGIIVNPTNAAEESKIDFEVRRDGDLESRMEVGPDKVEVSSTTGGMVMPRMTTTQRNAIASPSNGEMVYDTDLNKFYGYANNVWTALH